MRIDDRKVNGSIMIDNTDIVDAFNIRIVGSVPEWVFWNHATNGPEQIDSGIVVNDLNRALRRSPLTMLRFNISKVDGDMTTYFSPSSYTLSSDNLLVFSIKELIPDKDVMQISLNEGFIALA